MFELEFESLTRSHNFGQSNTGESSKGRKIGSDPKNGSSNLSSPAKVQNGTLKTEQCENNIAGTSTNGRSPDFESGCAY